MLFMTAGNTLTILECHPNIYVHKCLNVFLEQLSNSCNLSTQKSNVVKINMHLEIGKSLMLKKYKYFGIKI